MQNLVARNVYHLDIIRCRFISYSNFQFRIRAVIFAISNLVRPASSSKSDKLFIFSWIVSWDNLPYIANMRIIQIKSTCCACIFFIDFIILEASDKQQIALLLRNYEGRKHGKTRSDCRVGTLKEAGLHRGLLNKNGRYQKWQKLAPFIKAK